PAASLMKIITASAVIEKNNLDPEDELSYRGGCMRLTNINWLVDPRRDSQMMTFAKAFGVSCNTIFGRLALYNVGLPTLKSFSEKFMFNKPIPSDIKLQTSLFLLPSVHSATPQEVAEAGAGFSPSRISPVHAALLAAVVGNNGIMMAPYLVESAYDAHGKLVYSAKPQQVSHVFSSQTAEKIKILMQETIASGTGRMYFRKNGTRDEIAEIGGKTGTLSDPENRDILYNWFSGIAPLSSPNSVAIGTFVASPNNWVIRASSIAQKTLANYLKIERDEQRVATSW
ncbi:MAG: hypothetical protein K2X39_05750, partial [Silvanigrellaceae bacterium]|nr:hypothetical protein [Silvanigrellaceae bacterium]